ncbi:type II toxin-antitoxin system RelE/ParE family toxin [Desulfonatronum parangueonense]
MNEKYQVVWAEIAQNDLKIIIDYIALDSPEDAKRILQKIRQTTSTLYIMPDRGRIVPELKEQGINVYRELIVAPWRVIYRASDTKVIVLSVIDSRRNVEDVLLDLFYR